jgi:hypothetical protein
MPKSEVLVLVTTACSRADVSSELSGENHAPAANIGGGKAPGYSFNRRLNAPTTVMETKEICCPSRESNQESCVVPSTALSIYRLSYPESA